MSSAEHVPVVKRQRKQFVLVSNNNQSASDRRPSIKIRVNPLTQRASTSNIANTLQQIQSDSLNNNQLANDLPEICQIGADSIQANFMNTQLAVAATIEQQQQELQKKSKDAGSASSSRQPQRRRCRRKAGTHDDQAEHLTEMSVRGLNLFRYAKIFEGIYQCTECAKENIQKTFKNKYSFQRHAFLYHEGTSRKVFPCPVCNKEFSRPDKMKNHMKMTHDGLVPKDEAAAPVPAKKSGRAQAAQPDNSHNDTTDDTHKLLDDVQFDLQLADASQHIKVEMSD